MTDTSPEPELSVVVPIYLRGDYVATMDGDLQDDPAWNLVR
jgi:hypothetical protein